MTAPKPAFVNFPIRHPWFIVAAVLALTLILGLQIPNIQIDTDPENMLSEEEFVRVFHNRVKKEFSLYDMIVLGVVNEDNESGVFNPSTLGKVYELTRNIETLEGVIPVDLLAPSKVDDIQQAGLGTVRFEWLMPSPPKTAEEALRIRDRARENPMLYGTLLSEDGKALCLYIPIQSKTMSYRIAAQVREHFSKFNGPEQYYITGLPVAEDTFGIEMFRQMAISAPLAGLIIFILMWMFFRSFLLVMSSMIVAGVTVICTMGLLIGMGYTVHIMSSMIPIFLMPIAVVDSIHILSEFFDRYQIYKDRRETIVHVMQELFSPMLYTSLTSAAGFASLALTPNPPVRVFGIFVTIGILLAWILTILFIPAFIMLLKEDSLKSFGLNHAASDKPSALERWLKPLAGWTFRHYRAIAGWSAGVMVISAIGISLIVINDNPVKWFESKHSIRVADKVLNAHFGGTYMAYLVLEEGRNEAGFQQEVGAIRKELSGRIEELQTDVPQLLNIQNDALNLVTEFSEHQKSSADFSVAKLLQMLEDRAVERTRTAGQNAEAWDEVSLLFNEQKVKYQPFKNPEILKTLENLEEALMQSGAVGKVNSVVDVIKKVHYELMEGNKEFNVIPKTPAAVAQTLLSYQNSHDPDDLWHLVTPDYQKANLWIQLKSGDNKDMEPVLKTVEDFFKNNSHKGNLSAQWAGLTYLNVVWQDKMVHGMLNSLMGSFVMVFLMSAFLFRSALWGLLCMVPLTVTITLVYGLIGFIGKDYDMPVAVLSAMTLGLSVDFAIHFLQRSRSVYLRTNRNWGKAVEEMYGEPARAISRNILVIAVGFTPLLISPLIPYQTVGFLLASIMVVSGVATLLILPALIRMMETRLFKNR
ncbi:MAG: MMPL family transporter [Nitrospinota bacterium]|nr:MMPL family transporter [Nitrospinota bacterium]